MGKATAEARKWSRNPRLLAVIGVGPGGSRPEEREVWIFTYADADHATSTFKVRVSDGIVSSAREILPIWTEDSADFALRGCLPIDVKFLDTPQVVARAGKQNLPPTEYRQSYYLTLVRPASDNCGGSEGTFGDMDGYIDKFPQLRPYPRGAVHRAVWVIVNDEEALFLDAKTGETLARRRFRKQRPAGPVADE
ncbi:MAG: hypothetical protein HY078_17075 [Elusimicrobia bacterium]|nr:hypothetical protein [Elusimicrobiota bacterium]